MLPEKLKKAFGSLKKTAFPELVIVEVCGFCNLRCIMCPSPNLKRARGIMDWGIYTKVVDEIAEESPSTQLWPAIMGEPLLIGNRILNYISYAKERGIEVILNTNGTLLTPETYQKLTKAKLDKIIVGIDAFQKKTYEQIRIGGDFGRLKKNLTEILKMKGPTVILQFIEMEENVGELENFKKYWLSKGAVLKIRKKAGWGKGVEPYGLNIPPDSEERLPCPWLMRGINIHWNGKIIQCDADYEGEHVAGDIKIQTILDVWNSELKKRRDRHWNRDFDFMPCRECKDWQIGLSEWHYP